MSASRRNFFKILSALPLAVLGRQTDASVSAPKLARRLLLNRFSIAGFQYYDGPALVHQLRPGEKMIYKNGQGSGSVEESACRASRGAGPRKLHAGCLLDLLGESDNPHDPFAVSIYLGETKLGYVPRSDNKHISRLLDQDAKLDCRVIEVDPAAGVWNTVRVEVGLVIV